MGVTFAPPEPQVVESGERASPRTVLTCFWAFSAFIWSIFTPPEYTFPVRVLLLQPFWILRIYFNDETWVQDLLIVLLLNTSFTLWTGAWSPPNIPAIIASIDNETIQLYLRVFTALGGCGLLAGAIVYRGQQLEQAANEESEPIKTIDENPLPPLLVPSRTTHTRLSPKKHSFSYSYLFVGIPIGVKGRFGKVLSVDTERRGCFHVAAEDHLLRGGANKTLQQKLTSYLNTQGVKDSDYEFAYLVTAPRFLGYNFNPVSFWYIYDEDMTLKYMIPEVNNTFGERRIYLLKPGVGEPDNTHGSNGSSTKSLTFVQSWEKDFHVSPFNSRKGSYSIRTIDPLATMSEKHGPRFDTTIVLRSSKDETKIIARVFSEGPSLNPTTIGLLRLSRFIVSWWWVGFMTLPRILWEARKLYFAKALNLYFRPEVTSISIGRAFTSDEEILEAFFRAFLTDVVEEARSPLRVVYEPPHTDREIVLYSSAFTHQEDRKQTLTLKVISPAFYSRFIHYAHAQEAFDRESLATHEQNRTAIIEPASLMSVLLDAVKYRRQRITRTNPSVGLRWRVMTWLRCPPAEASFKTMSAQAQYGVEDIRQFGSSELDLYVRLRCEEPHVYRRIASKLFLAQRLCFGVPAILAALDIFARAVVVLVAMSYIEQLDCFDILRPRTQRKDDIPPILIMLLMANTIHIWAFVKG